MKIYYIHIMPPACFRHQCGHPVQSIHRWTGMEIYRDQVKRTTLPEQGWSQL